jgi:putative transposase
MSHAFYLTPPELKQIEIAMTDDRPLVRQRAKALYMAHQGHTFQKIATEVNVKARSTIYGWIKRWQADGIDGLTNADKSGRPPLMSEADCQVLEAITVMQPHDFGLDQRGWTVEALNQIMLEKIGVLISDKTLRAVLHELGYTFRLVRQRGQANTQNLPRTPEEFERYREQLKASSGTQRAFRTWYKAK